jgi:hypothetical protein
MAKNAAILQNSQDPREIVDTACAFAASDAAADQAVVLQFLNSKRSLDQLNTPREYAALPPKRLKVARVLRTLMDSPHAAAKPTLVALTKANDFLSYELLQDLLVRALAAVRPSPAAAVAYWDSHSQPSSSNLHLVIEAIFANGSDPALALFEKKIADPQLEVEYRTIWLRDPMLRHRNETPVLRCCERMVIQGTAPEFMRPVVVEALCDYDRSWYLACKKPRPPLRALASRESKDILKKICEFALDKLTLTAGQRLAVETSLVEAGGKKKDAPPGAKA